MKCPAVHWLWLLVLGAVLFGVSGCTTNEAGNKAFCSVTAGLAAPKSLKVTLSPDWNAKDVVPAFQSMPMVSQLSATPSPTQTRLVAARAGGPTITAISFGVVVMMLVSLAL